VGNANSSIIGVDTQCSPSTVVRTGGVGATVNPNFQQPYYQATIYGPNLQPVLDPYYTRTPAAPLATEGAQPGMTESVREQVARMLREFGLEPRGRAKTYQKPYPEFFDTVLFPREFRVPDFVKFIGEDSKTTYEHIGQFLAQVSDYGITDMHKIRLFPLSLSEATFNWFVSLAPNMVNTWEHLEQKFHDYFFNGESELRLSHLAGVKQKHNKIVSDYMRRFCDIRNKCYSLTIGDRDLAELAFVGLSTTMKDCMEGQDFVDVNHLLQHSLALEGRVNEYKAQSRFRETNTKEKSVVNYVWKDSASDDDADICITEWVDTPRDKTLACSFLKPSPGKRDDVKFTFDVTKCDKLFDLLMQNNVIRLSLSHVVPTAEQMTKGMYCKWHGTFSHNTNDCNYFHPFGYKRWPVNSQRRKQDEARCLSIPSQCQHDQLRREKSSCADRLGRHHPRQEGDQGGRTKTEDDVAKES
jgi:hypothetical protein